MATKEYIVKKDGGTIRIDKEKFPPGSKIRLEEKEAMELRHMLQEPTLVERITDKKNEEKGK